VKPAPLTPREATLTEDISPRASALAESLRAFGYDLGTAVADLADNSISAGAENVWIDFVWDGADSSIIITDDGRGMSEPKLRDAMRLGSRHPRDTRATDDLGRFGLGLKTASFSQSRCVTVCTKEAGEPPFLRRWDLDHLAKADAWQVLLDARSDSAHHFKRLNQLSSGTCILWQHMDRVMRGLERGEEKHRDTFIARCVEVERHLALVFHRLLEQPSRLRLFINEHSVQPFDPFFIGEATQQLQEHYLQSASGLVHVEPFIMPHESKLVDADECKLAGDPKDWTARQGFYIYRQDRLLVPSSWLGYREWRKDERHKLARIRISLPNTSDEDWQLDVTKSKARPPEVLREKLRSIGETTRARALRVMSFRGERISTPGARRVRHVWDQFIQHGRTSYRINRDHPTVASLLSDRAQKPAIDALLKLIEESIPVALIAYQSQEEPKKPAPSPTEPEVQSMRAMIRQAWYNLRSKGLCSSDALALLANWQPFDQHPALLQELRDNPPVRS
jgi:hypothetical protein